MNAGDRIGESTGASSHFTGCPAEVEDTYEGELKWRLKASL
jgi:hypothetical protein